VGFRVVEEHIMSVAWVYLTSLESIDALLNTRQVRCFTPALLFDYCKLKMKTSLATIKRGQSNNNTHESCNGCCFHMWSRSIRMQVKVVGILILECYTMIIPPKTFIQGLELPIREQSHFKQSDQNVTTIMYVPESVHS
jgi:hypothetical protein